MGKKIHDLLRFSEFLSEFRKVRRQIYANGEDRFENDAEHSYMLAMSAWYVTQKEGLKLDLSKTLKYALVHDIVEVYAGDTYFYAADKKDKEKRERAAAKRIKREFAEFPELHALIHEYEGRKDAESRFVYALDKLQPIIQLYLDGGRRYREKKVTLSMLKENKTDKVSIDVEVRKHFDEFVAILEKKEEQVFGAPGSKTYTMRIRASDKEIFEAICDGRKSIETRAATPRYARAKKGDFLRFVCGDRVVEKRIVRAEIFKGVEALMRRYKPTDIHPGLKTKADILKLYESFDGYKEKIRKMGIVAWRLE